MKVYEAIASALQARLNCERMGNTEWFVRHGERIEELVKKHLPRGSGFDSGTQFDFDTSTPERLVFNTEFHHMDGNGFYTHWTTHRVIVRPSLLLRFTVSISGPNPNQFKDYAHQIFGVALNDEVAE